MYYLKSCLCACLVAGCLCIGCNLLFARYASVSILFYLFTRSSGLIKIEMTGKLLKIQSENKIHSILPSEHIEQLTSVSLDSTISVGNEKIHRNRPQQKVYTPPITNRHVIVGLFH